jgi:hypothetical protein
VPWSSELAPQNGFGFFSVVSSRPDNPTGENLMSNRDDQKKPAAKNPSNTIKDPDEWTTGEEPMTGAQESYLHTLATEAGEEVGEDLTKAEASKKIDELRDKTGRGN